MTGSTRIPPTEITGLYGTLMKMMSKRMVGHVPDSLAVMWNHPAVLKDMAQFGRKVEKWDQLDPNLSSFASMATAALVGCSFCLDLHYFLAHNHGLDEAKAREVPRWRESSVFTPLERRVMEYAEAMSQTPPAVTDELSDELLAELGAPALLELSATVAYLNASARANIALGIHSEGFADACDLAPLASRAADDVVSPI
jgi:AhpD family alkylhydroperoxidase